MGTTLKDNEDAAEVILVSEIERKALLRGSKWSLSKEVVEMLSIMNVFVTSFDNAKMVTNGCNKKKRHKAT